jgi:serine/threonine protein kinase
METTLHCDASREKGPGMRQALSTSAPAEQATKTPSRFGPYDLVRILGQGGMGAVYEAWDSRTDTRVAIKVLRRDDAVSCERFRREIQVLKRLRHKGVVSFLQDGDCGPRMPWFAMELLQGRTLRDYNSELWSQSARDAITLPVHVVGDYDEPIHVCSPRSGPREVSPVASRLKEIGRLYEQVFRAVERIHAEGVTHGDLSPTNVFVRADGSPVLLDFGLAAPGRSEVVPDKDENALQPIAGTAHYLAPEQIRRERIEPRTDLYSLGCMIYETLTGTPPFDALEAAAVLRAHVDLRPTRLSAFWPRIPAALEDLVFSLLEKQQQDRPRSAGIVADRLALIVASEEHGSAGTHQQSLRSCAAIAAGGQRVEAA